MRQRLFYLFCLFNLFRNCLEGGHNYHHIIIICILRSAMYALYLDWSRISAHFVFSVVFGGQFKTNLVSIGILS